QAHDVKIHATDHATLNGTRLAQACHGEAHGGEVTERTYGFNAGAQVLDLGYRKRGVFVAHAGSALPDIDQPVLTAVDERLEENAAHQREDGSVSPDAQ